jgi:hypothetical protein
VLGGDGLDIHARIDALHKKLKDDYTVRWELDCYLLALYYDSKNPLEWMVLDISDTYHYHNLPDLMHVIRNTLMGLCCSPWLQRLFNIFLCGKRYRRLINTSDNSCQLSAAIINTLHGLLLGLYPFNERRIDFQKRVWIAGTLRGVMTSSAHMAFITDHPHLLRLSLAEYILNVVHDFCPVEWSLLGISSGAKSQCLALLEAFRENTVSPVAGQAQFWERLEADAQAAVSTMIKFFRDTSLYQHRSRSILPASMIRHLPRALETRMIQNSSSIFGQLRCAHHDIEFKESEALEEIWTSIYTRQLPMHTTYKQMETLTKMGAMCCLVEEELHHFPICLSCALTRRADILKGLFRYDPVQSQLVCNECLDHRSIVRVNLLGRILYVREKAIILCEACLQPKYWDSVCSCATEALPGANSCCVCQNFNTVSCKDVIDVRRFEMRVVHFCYKHSLSCVLSNETVYDTRTLEEEMRNRTFKSAKSGQCQIAQ